MSVSRRLGCFLALSQCWILGPFNSDNGLAQRQVTTMQAGCPDLGAVCSGVSFIGHHEDLDVVKSEPYQAQANAENKRTLADGSHTDQTTTAMVARDSEGRTVRVQKLDNGASVTTIFDPVAGRHIDYSSDTRIAHVMPLPQALPAKPALTGSDGSFEAAVTRAKGEIAPLLLQEASTSSHETSKSESLGAKTIDGIQVTGTLSTRTIPAGTIGNDKDITITRETWHSTELQLDLLNIQNDPRFGRTTYTLTNIQRSEPDEALFRVPPDYKVEETSLPAPPR